MWSLRALFLLSLCFFSPAQAGLFSDDEAHQKIKLLQERVAKLEALGLEDAIKQQTKSILDLQNQLEDLKNELRKLRGQNEELAHGLQDAEKREKDFYVDLDTRLRHVESTDNAPPLVNSNVNDTENRAFESAFALVKSGNHAGAIKSLLDFSKKYPSSSQMPNVLYSLANAQLALMDTDAALTSYQKLLENYPDTPKAADAMFSMANCQEDLKQIAAAQKTLKQLIVKYPNTAAADKARKQLAVVK